MKSRNARPVCAQCEQGRRACPVARRQIRQCRRCARSRASNGFFESGFNLEEPDFRSVVCIITNNRFKLSALFLGKKQIFRHGKRGPARSDRDPHQTGKPLKPSRQSATTQAKRGGEEIPQPGSVGQSMQTLTPRARVLSGSSPAWVKNSYP